MSYVLAFAGFAALVILHELGHFAAAKAVGMRVERFSLFFPPTLLRLRRGETEYAIGAIPLGGYVKITGMNPAELAAHDPQAPARSFGSRAADPPAQMGAGTQAGATSEPVEPSALARAYINQPVWKRVVVIAAGPAVNLVLAFAIFTAVFALTGQRQATTSVSGVQQRPASTVLRPGDRIVSIEGRPASVDLITKTLHADTCPGPLTAGCAGRRPVTIGVQRGGRQLSFSVVPLYRAQERTMLLGFTFGTRTLPPQPVDVAAASAVSQMWTITSQSVSTFVRIFTSAQARHQLHGTVGLYKVTQQAFGFSATDAFYLLGVISLALAVFNLFPFLPLDGGHIFWALAEKVRGRSIPFWVMERASAVGFLLVIGIFLIGLNNDVQQLTHGGFKVQ